MAQYARVLVGYDGSEAARRALERATALAAVGDSELTVLTVMQTHVSSLGRLPPDREQENRAEALLREAYERLTSAGVRARGERIAGDPGERLVAEAERRDADVIVVGTHGKPFAERLLLGSVSAHVVAHAPCDVLVVR